MSKKRSTSRTRGKHEAEHGRKFCRENKLCRECGKGLTGRRTAWCSNECSEAAQIRAWPSHARYAVFKRDKGVCCHCGLDTARIRGEVRRAMMAVKKKMLDAMGKHGRRPRLRQVRNYDPIKKARLQVLQKYGMGEAELFRKTYWDMDHEHPVSEGGGECGLDNLQTLCIPCHKKKSRRGARRRARRKRRESNQ